MTRQLPKPVAVPLGRLLFGAINAGIYSAGWVIVQCVNVRDARRSRRAARQVWREADKILRDGAK